MKNKSFLYINLAMGCYCGIFYAFPALLGDLLTCYGYTESEVSILGYHARSRGRLRHRRRSIRPEDA